MSSISAKGPAFAPIPAKLVEVLEHDGSLLGNLGDTHMSDAQGTAEPCLRCNAEELWQELMDNVGLNSASVVGSFEEPSYEELLEVARYDAYNMG